MKNSLVKTFGAAALILSMAAPSAMADGLSQDQMAQLDQNCAVTRQKQITHEEAASCIVPFYQAAQQQAISLKAQIDNADLDRKVKRSLQVEIRKQCDFDGNDATFTEGTSPEAYLRQSQFCLATLTNAADDNDVSYDKDSAAYLIARLKLHRHLHIN